MRESRRVIKAMLGMLVVVAAGCAHTVTPAQLAHVQDSADAASTKADQAQRTANEALKRADQAEASANGIAPVADQALQAANDAKALAKADAEKAKRMMTKAMEK